MEPRRAPKNSLFESAKRGVLKFDLYKQPFKLLFNGGDEHFATFFGSTVSFIIFFLVLSYGIYKM